MSVFSKKPLVKNTMNLYIIVDCVAQKTSSIFEAANHAVMVRNLRQQKDFMANVDQYDIHQVGFIENYGEQAYQVQLDMKTWKAEDFIGKYEYKAPDLKTGAQ